MAPRSLWHHGSRLAFPKLRLRETDKVPQSRPEAPKVYGVAFSVVVSAD